MNEVPKNAVFHCTTFFKIIIIMIIITIIILIVIIVKILLRNGNQNVSTYAMSLNGLGQAVSQPQGG